jgi:hypothetical protein
MIFIKVTIMCYMISYSTFLSIPFNFPLTTNGRFLLRLVTKIASSPSQSSPSTRKLRLEEEEQKGTWSSAVSLCCLHRHEEFLHESLHLVGPVVRNEMLISYGRAPAVG